MIFNTRAQETGPIQKIFMGMLIAIGMSIAVFNFIGQGIIPNYDTPALSDESAFNSYQGNVDNLSNNIDSVRSDIISPNSTALDKIDAVVFGGFSALTDLVIQPILVLEEMFRTVLTDNLNIPNELVQLVYLAISVIIIFAILALIMKVRA